jgi:hypothetical protein
MRGGDLGVLTGGFTGISGLVLFIVEERAVK